MLKKIRPNFNRIFIGVMNVHRTRNNFGKTNILLSILLFHNYLFLSIVLNKKESSSIQSTSMSPPIGVRFHLRNSGRLSHELENCLPLSKNLPFSFAKHGDNHE